MVDELEPEEDLTTTRSPAFSSFDFIAVYTPSDSPKATGIGLSFPPAKT
jgi:hypothetical protein